MTTLYGIKNCDTIKKARKWLETNGIDYQFHDFRTDGLSEKQLKAWVKELGWGTLLNKRGTTWRKLPDKTKDSINEKNAIALMLGQPTMIKRPVLDLGKQRKVGFSEKDYAELFGT